MPHTQPPPAVRITAGLLRRGCGWLAIGLAAGGALRPALAGPPCFAQPSGASDAADAAKRILTVRARADLAGGSGALMLVRINGRQAGAVEVRSTDWVDHAFHAEDLAAGVAVDVAFANDAVHSGQDRNLFIATLGDGRITVQPSLPGAVLDRGDGDKAFDGLDTRPGQGSLYGNAALRLTWPSAASQAPTLRDCEAARLLMQATFGPSPQEIARVAQLGVPGWLATQMAQPAQPGHVAAMTARFVQGAEFRPGGARYDVNAVANRFWAGVAGGEQPLRQRMAWALHQVFMASQFDAQLVLHGRSYAAYLDALERHAFGNFRALLEDMALSPAMGLYLSHMRNRKEDPASGRQPDENFAREVMQLFTIGLVELNADATPRLDAAGKPVETYNNTDVMALAKVFTGYSWALPDKPLDEPTFRWGMPDYAHLADPRADILPMKLYPAMHSSAEKRLFTGKPWALTLPAGGKPQDELHASLDTLFHHPNVGPFIGRQLIQHLVAANPSPAYVARVARVFADNGRSVRGDLGAVLRAVLLDSEARQSVPSSAAKLREPVLRVAHWMRALGVQSRSGNFMMAGELQAVSQRALYAPSVFGYFRPGHVPANTAFATRRATAPEFQLVSEATVAGWVNLADAMSGSGLGWNGSGADVAADFTVLNALLADGQTEPLLQHLDLLLFGGRMSAALRQALIDAMAGVGGSAGDTKSLNQRVRMALLVALASPEFAVQR